MSEAEPRQISGAVSRGALVLLGAILCAGIAIGIYLTRFHEIEMYGDRTATLSNCPRTETTNCEVVNTSGYSEIAGVPISALAIPSYLLLLILAARAWRRPRLLSLVFASGLVLLLYSLYLFYVSRVVIGYLCLWCFRLYMINAGIPLLAALAAGCGPALMMREVLRDIRRAAPEVRQAVLVFASLLIATVSIDQIYRSGLTRVAPESAEASPPGVEGVVAPEPPAPSESRGRPLPAQAPAEPAGGSPATRVVEAASEAFVVPGPLKLIEARHEQLREVSFDLQGRIGRGKPVALIFWAPGYALSEGELVEVVRFLAREAPQYDLFAVAGKRDDQRTEMVWEAFSLLDLPPSLPLLVDEGFAVSKQLDVTDVPDLLLIDGAGHLVTAKIKGLHQTVTAPPDQLAAAELIRRVAGGAKVPPLPALPPYYPATELYGHCAPEFSLPDLSGARDVAFQGRAANGKPTLLMFWSATCKHCQKEIPQLLSYVRAHPGEFNVVSVALIKPDRPDGTSHRRITEAYVRSNGIPWQVLDDSSGFAADLYKIVSTPTTFLLTPGGAIAGAWYHPHEEIGEAIRQAMSRLTAMQGECTPAPPATVSRASFSALDPAGTSVTLGSVTDRPTIVHFWATWCVPCQTELPDLLRFRDRLEKEGGRLVLVSVEDAPAGPRIREFGARLDPRFVSLRAPQGGLADRLDLSYSVPRTFLLGSGGRVLRTYYGAQKWSDPAFRENVRTLLQLPRSSG